MQAINKTAANIDLYFLGILQFSFSGSFTMIQSRARSLPNGGYVRKRDSGATRAEHLSPKLKTKNVIE
jgi:hypothetical protein